MLMSTIRVALRRSSSAWHSGSGCQREASEHSRRLGAAQDLAELDVDDLAAITQADGLGWQGPRPRLDEQSRTTEFSSLLPKLPIWSAFKQEGSKPLCQTIRHNDRNDHDGAPCSIFLENY
jgi:hypothetical protein